MSSYPYEGGRERIPAEWLGGGRIPGPVPDDLPPQNLEAERGVLGSIVLDPGVLPRVREIVRADDFHRNPHRLVFRALLFLADAGRPIDAITLADELVRRGEFAEVGADEGLGDILSSVPHAAHAEYYAQIVRQKALTRRLLVDAQERILAIRSNQYTAEELVALAGENLQRVVDLAPAPAAPPAQVKGYPAPPATAVWHGLAGDLVRLIAPETEADRMAILGQFLAGFGNLVGRRAFWRAEATRHHCNLFLAVVGNSAKARKGTSWGIVTMLLRGCDPTWADDRILSGLSSGEGLIWTVRDPIIRREKKQGSSLMGGGGYQEVEVDPGVPDKRVLFVESEFGSTLGVLGREGNTLSGVLRNAWDGSPLNSATKNNPARSIGAHVSVVAHVTHEDLNARLSSTDAANGFGNRFLWLCVKRSQYLPFGGRIGDLNFTDVCKRLKEAADFARDESFEAELLLRRDLAADRLWEDVYPRLSAARPGLMGSITSRAEPQAMRIAAIYALLDKSTLIRVEHLQAGLAFWRYCEDSAAFIFADSLGDPDAETLLEALKQAGEEGLSLTRIRCEVFAGHRSKEQIERALAVLCRAGMAEPFEAAPNGRTVRLWRYVAGV